jgi:diadenosine tetraphosphate (Ap4A) HIT family hydrolase
MFRTDAAFAAAEPLGDLGLCHARLQRDVRYPWIVLVPRVVDARELGDLDEAVRRTLMDEIIAAGAAVRAVAAALGRPIARLNVGQLGNITPQLHVHVVGRHPDDPAWPGPVWGHSPAEDYPPAQLAVATSAARGALCLSG